MARPGKEGIEYFPLDTMMDDNFELVEAKYGAEGFRVIIKMWQKIYRENGYFLEWDERARILFSKRINVEINLVDTIITDAVETGLFDSELFKKGILTSSGIQKRFFEAAKRRIVLPVYENLLLVDLTTIGITRKNYQEIKLSRYVFPDEGERDKAEIIPEITPQEPVLATQKPVFKYQVNDGASRLSKSQKSWNLKELVPASRVSVIQFRPEELSGCLAIIQAYSDEEIENALDNYSKILQSTKHEIDVKYQYQSFQGFIMKGVEKFVSSADPWTRCLKKAAVTGKQTPDRVTMETTTCRSCGAESKSTGSCGYCGYYPGMDCTPEEHAAWFADEQAGKNERVDARGIMFGFLENRISEKEDSG